MAGRLSALLDVIRPRTIARAVKSVDDLALIARDLKRLVKQLEQRAAQTDARTSALEATLRTLSDAVAELRVRESRLRAIYQRDIDLQPALDAVDGILDAASIRSHVERSVESAALDPDPFPHLVLEDLFPRPFYEAVLRGIPPVEMFDGTENKQRIVVPFEMAPAFSRRVWGFLLHSVVDDIIGPALIRKFRQPLNEWLQATWPELAGQSLESRVKLQSTDGRILLRRRGYLIPPHRDPKWGFVTCLLYLARPGDSPAWGTQLYHVEGDTEAVNVAPHWIGAELCRLAKDVSFRPNTALAFMNSRGAHGARIPADAEPPDLERYVYQFRLGPSPESIRTLQALLPNDRREMWSGKRVDYA
jgi:uncharacterized coiled-coil protein SlyX